MVRNRRTAFNRYFERRMKDPTFAAQYRETRTEIDATDKLIRALEMARQQAAISKAELAHRIDAKPEMVRRLLTVADGNPTMSTVLKVASAVGYHLELVRNIGPRVGRKAAPRVKAARQAKR
jgi:DNA-binding phage protein